MLQQQQQPLQQQPQPPAQQMAVPRGRPRRANQIRPSCNDWFLLGALAYTCVGTIMAWEGDTYAGCPTTIPVFLVISYLTVMIWHCHKFMEQHWLYHPGIRKKIMYSKYGFTYVFFIAWIISGTVWFAQNSECLQDNDEFWFILIWLVLCYLWIIGFGVVMASQWHLIKRQLHLLEEARHGRFQGINPFPIMTARFNLNPIARGLGSADIESLPTREPTEKDLQEVCSVCLDEFEQKSLIKSLPACGHAFHAECIDEWLSRKNDCPNCRTKVERSGRVTPEPSAANNAAAFAANGPEQRVIVHRLSRGPGGHGAVLHTTGPGGEQQVLVAMPTRVVTMRDTRSNMR